MPITVWDDLQLTEGSDQYSTEEIINLLHKTQELGAHFCKWFRRPAVVFASIEDSLMEAGILRHYDNRISVLDFSVLINRKQMTV